MSFSSLGLSVELLRAIADQAYESPTPVQAETIPAILTGTDIMACAQTGTGKTAAFTLPILQKLQGSPTGPKKKVRALVLAPTRELALQVHESVTTYGKYLSLRAAAIFGGVNINPQFKTLSQGVDVLVATPGRLIDHLDRSTVDLSSVEILVLDEADRMLDMGFIKPLERILRKLPGRRQNLMFSATFSPTVKELAQKYLKSPRLVEVARENSAAESVSQSGYWVDKGRKRALLSYLIGSRDARQVLVFTRTKRGADRLAKQLGQDGIDAMAIHGDKSQGARNRALAAFKSRSVRVLVATDVAARGLDIDQLPLVVNYDLPDNPEDYVHRIGRTGRGGRSGEALSLICADEHAQWVAIGRLVKIEVPVSVADGFEPEDQAAAPPRNVRAPRQADVRAARRRNPNPRRRSINRPERRSV